MYLYILSRPHSGSTILDILMGASASTESVGQLVSDIDKLGNVCSCGATIQDCPFWSRVRTGLQARGVDPARGARLEVDQAHIGRWLKTWWQPRDLARVSPETRELAAADAALEAAIAEAAGKPHVLDSSKEPTRGLFLGRYLPSARLIHLVRDPRAAVQSHWWRVKGDKGFHFLRREYKAPWLAPFFLALAAASWTVGNLLSEVACRAAPGRSLRLRYEDLRDHPADTLRLIGRTFGLDLDDAVRRVEAGESFPVGHNIGGNRIRREGAVRFDPGKERTRDALPGWALAMTLVLCWPLMRRYGYPLRQGRPPAGTPQTARA